MTTALYRRYRPETFADVIGQEHVTTPLMRALETGRVNHAYLFSGPRGCGKTTSARILARCLNCEQGPTAIPCGVCDSCVALARGGAGTIDVIEIDAASHGGVDDARDLRERAAYGPATSRFKVYIIDEAHMVTTQGFNALLKVVEEPPEHVKFIFATTEPDKVIGTIRSRTHHYPFRLVPPQRLTDYMEHLCAAEGVRAEPGVLSFVTRAGGGSVRDSLSVLDQLIAGSDDGGLTYAGAASLLGFTDSELLDATVDALGASDPAATFRQIGRIIESGHDPRRFVEDLLERLRDLIIVAAVPEGVAQVLRGVPEDQLERMRQQAAAFGSQALARAATIVNTGLTEMTGATAPRLQLELICARVLLPGASGEEGYAARLERLERRLDIGGPTPSVRPVPTAQPEATPAPASAPGVSTPASGEDPAPPAHGPDEPVEVTRSEGRDIPEDASSVREAPAADAPAQSSPHGSAPAAAPGGGLDTDAVRRAWPDVLDAIAGIKRVTWALLSQHAQVQEYTGTDLTLSVSSPGLAQTFERGSHRDVVRRALEQTLGITVVVHARPADTADRAPSGVVPDEAAEAPGTVTDREPQPGDTAGPLGESGGGWDEPAGQLTSAAADQPERIERPERVERPRERRTAARRPPRQPEVEPGGWGAVPQAAAPSWADPEPVAAVADPEPERDEGSRDDPDVDNAGEVGIPVVTSILGGVVIDDQRD